MSIFATLAAKRRFLFKKFKYMTPKQEFLDEHNKLSPVNLQATMALLTHFKTEKTTLFKGADWSLEKLRRPFIIWMTSLTVEEKKNINSEET